MGLSLSAIHVLLCHYTPRLSEDPFFGTRPQVFWLFHFANIFTSMTDCDRAGRNRRLCHLKTTYPQRHTRQLDIYITSQEAEKNPKEAVESDQQSCGLINEHRTKSKQIRDQWKLFDWVLCRVDHMVTTMPTASCVTQQCHIAHPSHPTLRIHVYSLFSHAVLLPIRIRNHLLHLHPCIFLITSAQAIHVAAI